MLAKKKILFLMPSMIGGGAERTLINLMERIDYSKYEIDLLLVSNYGPLLTQIPKDVNVISLFQNHFLVRVLAYLQKKYSFTSIFKEKLKKIKKKYDVSISYLDSNFTDLIFFINSDKKYTWVHASYKSNRNYNRYLSDDNYRKKLINERYNRLDGIIFVSNDAKDEFIEIFGRFSNMKTIYNIINTKDIISKSKIGTTLKNEKFHFITIGSLTPVKGFDRLIRASKIIVDKGFDFKLSILGEGFERKKLEKLINDLNLYEVVNLEGFKSNPYPFLKACDAFVMSSLSEALPTVLCEAMILGKPVVVTESSGCKELVDYGKYGLMSKQDDLDLAHNMIEYIENEELRNEYHKKSLERSSLFDDDKILSEYIELFDI